MLVTIDAGNTQTVVGVFEGGELIDHWRVSTDSARTADELALLVTGLLAGHGGLPGGRVDGMAVCSGVPRVTTALREMAERHLGTPPLVVGPGTRTGIPVRYDNPREVGPDRIANAVGALERFDPPVVVVDFGTATTLDAISAGGEYLGGIIVPGVELGLEALSRHAALLRRVELVAPRHPIGRSTEAAIRSGALYGTGALVDGLVARMEGELGPATVVGTGGLGELLAPFAERIAHVEPWLTLHGLRLVFERNQG